MDIIFDDDDDMMKKSNCDDYYVYEKHENRINEVDYLFSTSIENQWFYFCWICWLRISDVVNDERVLI